MYSSPNNVRFIIGKDKFNNRVFICITAKTQKALNLPLEGLKISYTPADGNSWKRSDYYRIGVGEESFSVELIETEVDVTYIGFKIGRKESDFSYSMGAMRPNKVERYVEFQKEVYKVGSNFKFNLDYPLQECDLRFDVKRK